MRLIRQNFRNTTGGVQEQNNLSGVGDNSLPDRFHANLDQLLAEQRHEADIANGNDDLNDGVVKTLQCRKVENYVI